MSQRHDGSWYVSFDFQNKVQCAALLQIRSLDVSRLYSRIGRVPVSDLDKIRNSIIRLLREPPR